MVSNFGEFCSALLASGFSMGGGNGKGVYAVVPYGWQEQQYMDVPARWHTGDPETDPWEWRMRVLEERSDIAYAKLFFSTGGYITAEWYPKFLAVRRGGRSFEDDWADGLVSDSARRIYETVAEHGDVPLHEIKRLGGFDRTENGRFERALLDLQMRLYLTMCGRMQKVNKFGEAYGWNTTVFCTVESFWARRGVSLPAEDPKTSYEAIRARLLALSPDAAPASVRRFIEG